MRDVFVGWDDYAVSEFASSWAPMPVSPTLTNLTGLYRKRVQQRTLMSSFLAPGRS